MNLFVNIGVAVSTLLGAGASLASLATEADLLGSPERTVQAEKVLDQFYAVNFVCVGDSSTREIRDAIRKGDQTYRSRHGAPVLYFVLNDIRAPGKLRTVTKAVMASAGGVVLHVESEIQKLDATSTAFRPVQTLIKCDRVGD